MIKNLFTIFAKNGAQFLNITPLFISSACLAAASFSAPVIVILPLTSMYASL